MRVHGADIDLVFEQRVADGRAGPVEHAAHTDDGRRRDDAAHRDRELLLRDRIECDEVFSRHGIELRQVDRVKPLDFVEVDVGHPDVRQRLDGLVADGPGEVCAETRGQVGELVDVRHQRPPRLSMSASTSAPSGSSLSKSLGLAARMSYTASLQCPSSSAFRASSAFATSCLKSAG